MNKSVIGSFGDMPNKGTAIGATPVQIYPSNSFLDLPVMTDNEWESLTKKQQAAQLAYELKIVNACELIMMGVSVK
jgi:hypothetical protein